MGRPAAGKALQNGAQLALRRLVRVDRLIIRGLLVLRSDHAIAYCLGAFRETPRKITDCAQASELDSAMLAAIRPVKDAITGVVQPSPRFRSRAPFGGIRGLVPERSHPAESISGHTPRPRGARRRRAKPVDPNSISHRRHRRFGGSNAPKVKLVMRTHRANHVPPLTRTTWRQVAPAEAAASAISARCSAPRPQSDERLRRPMKTGKMPA